MELINGNSEIIKDFFQSMEKILGGIGKLAKESRPHLNGEKFLSNREASKYLKVSIRTLQEWRDTGVIPYIQIKGKIIYRQSDKNGFCRPITTRNGRNNLSLLKNTFFLKLTKNINSISVVFHLCKPFKENTTRSVAQVWRFSLNPVGLGLERTEYGAYICYVLFSFGKRFIR
jgi:hypothetical protein